MNPNQRLKHEREQRGWSQSKLAGLVGTNPATIGRWERGVSLPYPFHRERLCVLFGKDARELGLVEGNTQPVEDAGSEHTPAFIFDPAIPMPSVETATLVGRDEMLAQLKQQLYLEGTLALSAINGLPGVGKTALALTLAHDSEVQSHFSDGILWVGLGIKPEVQELLSRWCVLLGLSSHEMADIKQLEEWTRILRGLIGQRKMLLVIDDAWQVDDALAFMVGGPNCASIVTTRFPQIGMQIAANQVTVVSELSEENGIALLARFVPALVKQDVATAQHLVQSVGALPLALVLVGKYLRSHAYNEQPRRLRSAIRYVDDIEQRFDLREPRSPAQPHPSLRNGAPLSLRSIIALSDEQLDEQAHAMLRSLAIFPAKPASFPEQAATAVSTLPVEVLDRLCDAGLLESSGPERYMLHQTIADYARTQVGEDTTLLYQRLAIFVGDYVETNEQDYDALEREYSIIVLALEEAESRELWSEYVQGVCAFAPFLCIRGLYEQAAQYLQRAYAAASSWEDQDTKAALLFHLGHLATLQNDYALAESYLQNGLQLAGQEQQICLLLTRLGALVAKRGDYERAKSYLQEALLIARRLDEPEDICQVLTDLGHVMIRNGDYKQAEMHLQEGLVLASWLDSKKHRSDLLTELGLIAGSKDNYPQAYIYYQEALDDARRLSYQDAIIRLLINLSETVMALDNSSGQAEAFLQEGLALAQRFGNSSRRSHLLNNRGLLLSEQGNYAGACENFRESLSLARQINHPWLVYTILGEWGDTHLTHRHFEQARETFHEVITMAPENFQETRAKAHYGMARVMVELEHHFEARKHCEISIALCERLEIPTLQAARELLAALPITARAYYT